MLTTAPGHAVETAAGACPGTANEDRHQPLSLQQYVK